MLKGGRNKTVSECLPEIRPPKRRLTGNNLGAALSSSSALLVSTANSLGPSKNVHRAGGSPGAQWALVPPKTHNGGGLASYANEAFVAASDDILINRLMR